MATREVSPSHDPDLRPEVAAIILHAEFCADLVIAALRALKFLPLPDAPRGEPLGLPSAFLLEFAAVLELGLWERNGIQLHRAAGLPSYCEAMDALIEKATCWPSKSCSRTSDLSQRVLSLWLANFAREGKELIGGDILLDLTDQDTFLDAVAEFLWANRNQFKETIV
jgi:hypothetical protein